jgi:hypothetical protein
MARERSPRTYTLRRASSVVFALISVLPLLLFAYTLYALNVLQQATAQIGLGSALALAMIGFYIYSVMIARLSDMLREIEVNGTNAPHAAPSHPPVAVIEPEPGLSPSRAMTVPHCPRPKPRPLARRPRRAGTAEWPALDWSFPGWGASPSSLRVTAPRSRIST